MPSTGQPMRNVWALVNSVTIVILATVAVIDGYTNRSEHQARLADRKAYAAADSARAMKYTADTTALRQDLRGLKSRTASLSDSLRRARRQFNSLDQDFQDFNNETIGAIIDSENRNLNGWLRAQHGVDSLGAATDSGFHALEARDDTLAGQTALIPSIQKDAKNAVSIAAEAKITAAKGPSAFTRVLPWLQGTLDAIVIKHISDPPENKASTTK